MLYYRFQPSFFLGLAFFSVKVIAVPIPVSITTAPPIMTLNLSITLPSLSTAETASSLAISATTYLAPSSLASIAVLNLAVFDPTSLLPRASRTVGFDLNGSLVPLPIGSHNKGDTLDNLSDIQNHADSVPKAPNIPLGLSRDIELPPEHNHVAPDSLVAVSDGIEQFAEIDSSMPNSLGGGEDEEEPEVELGKNTSSSWFHKTRRDSRARSYNTTFSFNESAS